MTLDTHEDYLFLKEIYSKYVKIKEKTLRSLVALVSENRIWLDTMKIQILKNKK